MCVFKQTTTFLWYIDLQANSYSIFVIIFTKNAKTVKNILDRKTFTTSVYTASKIAVYQPAINTSTAMAFTL